MERGGRLDEREENQVGEEGDIERKKDDWRTGGIEDELFLIINEFNCLWNSYYTSYIYGIKNIKYIQTKIQTKTESC